MRIRNKEARKQGTMNAKKKTRKQGSKLIWGDYPCLPADKKSIDIRTATNWATLFSFNFVTMLFIKQT